MRSDQRSTCLCICATFLVLLSFPCPRRSTRNSLEPMEKEVSMALVSTMWPLSFEVPVVNTIADYLRSCDTLDHRKPTFRNPRRASY